MKCKCPSCFNNTLKLKIVFTTNGKQILKYSCDNCKYYKQEVVDYMKSNIILKNIYPYTTGGTTGGRGW